MHATERLRCGHRVAPRSPQSSPALNSVIMVTCRNTASALMRSALSVSTRFCPDRLNATCHVKKEGAGAVSQVTRAVHFSATAYQRWRWEPYSSALPLINGCVTECCERRAGEINALLQVQLCHRSKIRWLIYSCLSLLKKQKTNSDMLRFSFPPCHMLRRYLAMRSILIVIRKPPAERHRFTVSLRLRDSASPAEPRQTNIRVLSSRLGALWL